MWVAVGLHCDPWRFQFHTDARVHTQHVLLAIFSSSSARRSPRIDKAWIGPPDFDFQLRISRTASCNSSLLQRIHGLCQHILPRIAQCSLAALHVTGLHPSTAFLEAIAVAQWNIVRPNQNLSQTDRSSFKTTVTHVSGAIASSLQLQ